MIKKLEQRSIKELIRRIERAPDFSYDDLGVALNNKLKAQGKRWGWDGRKVAIKERAK